MTAKSELMQAHETMAKVLDAKFSNVPEWQAFRSIDRALLALEAEHPGASGVKGHTITVLPRRRPEGAPTPYLTLVGQALNEAKVPLTTMQLMEYIKMRRAVGSDPAKARIVVQSSLSKDDRFKSVQWGDEGRGRAWWFADREVPRI